ncbi:MAG: aldehyde dehydrogenase family protein, partial [Candidatus Adiutricales bacterium]
MEEILKRLDLVGEQSGAGTGAWLACSGKILESISPVDGRIIGSIRSAESVDYERVMEKALSAFEYWRMVPAPKRGEVVRQIGNAIREKKQDLGSLITLEMGKIEVEGEGEVQEMIDMADFAVGQSRMLYGLSMHSERPRHRLYEQWHPLGPVGVITSFNFPLAVWSWNAMLALIAGDSVIWKPSSKTPLTAIAVMKIIWRVLEANNLPEGILNLIIGGREEVGEAMINDSRMALVSATGSIAMGRHVAASAASRLGRTILELSGNNTVIVAPSADLDLTVRAIVFGSVGTAGQRCTTTRRVIAHQSIYTELSRALIKAYRQIRIGNPREEGVLMGPLVSLGAVEKMGIAIENLKGQGGQVLYGGEVLTGGVFETGTYVRPCICAARADMPIVREETFAPILYLMDYEDLEDAIDKQNRVPQGLTSAIFTTDLREAETFLSQIGSDCGIANVNIGTSGAEIGGAFGGEKDTGGGREAGSDAWKAYMRRQTCTINWSDELPLAQDIQFEIN